MKKGYGRLKIYRKSKNGKNNNIIKKKFKIGVSAMIGLTLLVIVSRFIIILSGDMPVMDDIYFLAYDNQMLETILYRFDVDLRKTNEVGKVAGYFHNCKIDSEKKYITGVCNLWPEAKYDDTESEFKLGIVRYSLEDGTLTLLRSEQQMRIGNKQSIFWDSCFPFDNGEKMLMCYADGIKAEIIFVISNILSNFLAAAIQGLKFITYIQKQVSVYFCIEMHQRQFSMNL